MKTQATRIKPPQPATGAGEKVGCILVALLFTAMICTVYAIPYVVAWAAGVL